jgi:hypothetical protein
MLSELVGAILILFLLLIGLTGPSLLAAHQWRFGGGKLLHDRLDPNPTHPKHEHL